MEFISFGASNWSRVCSSRAPFSVWKAAWTLFPVLHVMTSSIANERRNKCSLAESAAAQNEVEGGEPATDPYCWTFTAADLLIAHVDIFGRISKHSFSSSLYAATKRWHITAIYRVSHEMRSLYPDLPVELSRSYKLNKLLTDQIFFKHYLWSF